MPPLGFRNLLYSLPDNHLLPDANGRVLAPNDGHAASLRGGRSRAGVAGQRVGAVWPPRSEAASEVVPDSHAQVRRTRQPHPQHLAFEQTRNQRQD